PLCPSSDFAGYVDAARRRPLEATVLAVTPLVEDEKPLGAVLDADGRVLSLGGVAPTLVTAGMYLVSERARRLEPPARLGRLREHLQWLLEAGEPMYGEVIETVVGVDRAGGGAVPEAVAARHDTG